MNRPDPETRRKNAAFSRLTSSTLRFSAPPAPSAVKIQSVHPSIFATAWTTLPADIFCGRRLQTPHSGVIYSLNKLYPERMPMRG